MGSFRPSSLYAHLARDPVFWRFIITLRDRTAYCTIGPGSSRNLEGTLDSLCQDGNNYLAESSAVPRRAFALYLAVYHAPYLVMNAVMLVVGLCRVRSLFQTRFHRF
jgi:hypothetical protein